tara:strand:+ start:43 stop:666 length:624 start_codon:yes stop_codon:yes gene_type:complete
MNEFEETFRSTWSSVISSNPITDAGSDLTVAELFGRKELSHGQRIKLGNRMEKLVNGTLDNLTDVKSWKNFSNPNLWMNTTTNELTSGGRGKGEKDVDVLFEKDDIVYYLEVKSNLNLDTEKGTETIEKVGVITECLRNNFEFKGQEIVGKVLSIFWDNKNVPISGSMNLGNRDGHIMWFSEFIKLFDCDLNKEEYESICKEMGKEI